MENFLTFRGRESQSDVWCQRRNKHIPIVANETVAYRASNTIMKLFRVAVLLSLGSILNFAGAEECEGTRGWSSSLDKE